MMSCEVVVMMASERCWDAKREWEVVYIWYWRRGGGKAYTGALVNSSSY